MGGEGIGIAVDPNIGLALIAIVGAGFLVYVIGRVIKAFVKHND